MFFERLIIIVFILLGTLFFYVNARMLLRIKSMKQFMQDYWAGKVSWYEKLFFLNIGLFPKMYARMVEGSGDKLMTVMMHVLGWFLMAATLAGLGSAIFMIFAPLS